MPGRLDNRTAIITGASQGIGAAIAEVFAQEGADLILFDINIAQLELIAHDIGQKTHCSIQTGNVDVSDRTIVRDAIGRCLVDNRKIDILINNAGINVFNNPLELDELDWDKCLSVNLEGAWNCSQAILPHMVENQYGNIINITSVHSHKVIRGAFPYGVAKHGLLGLTRLLGVEYASSGIRVNSISPGLINTPLAEEYFSSCVNPEEERRRQVDIMPGKRIGEPSDIANTALFLASDEATFINAADILVDGGRSQVYCD